MKILVTAHNGFIGSNLTAYLTSKGHSVEGWEWQPNVVPSPEDFDWVIHLGAISSTTFTDVEQILEQNFEFSMRLLQLCENYNTNFQYASSASVYGPTTHFTEDGALLPQSPYAWSKYLMERYIRNHPQGAIVQMFRYFNVYGTGEEHKGHQASPFCQFKLQAEQDKEIVVFENSENYLRDFVPVKQVVDTHIKFLKSLESGIFNVGTGKTQSFMDVALSFDVPIKTKPMPDNLKLSYQTYTCADMTKTLKSIKEIS
jgi:ADP-L-glycero-D-manno-heptose 6-epimerase